MIETTYTVRTVTTKQGRATVMIDGAPVPATVDRLEVELVSDDGANVYLEDLPIVSAAGLEEQRSRFVTGTRVRRVLTPEAADVPLRAAAPATVTAPAMVVAPPA